MRTILFATLAAALLSCGKSSPGTSGSSVAQVEVSTAQTGASTTFSAGQTLALVAVAKNSSGGVISGASFTWSSSNTAVATVAGGTVTGVSAGTTGISASSGGVSSAPLAVTVVSSGGGNVTTISPDGGTATLSGVTTLTFPAGAFTAPQPVTVSSTTDAQTAATFDESTAIYDPGQRMAYEVRINTGTVGPALPVQAAIIVPGSLSVPAGQNLEAFAQIWEKGDLDALDQFELLPSTFGGTIATVTVSLPPAAFTDQRRADHTFEAIVTLAPTPGSPGHALLGAPPQGVAPAGCPVPSIQPPLDAVSITSPFDMNRRVVVNGVTYTGHWGTDLAAVTGTRILAAGDATVKQAVQSQSFGNTVVLDMPGHGAVRYAHLDFYGVATGDHVLAGQEIGATDNTGLSTGPHLHFEMAPNGNIASNKSKIDPAPCLTSLPLTWALSSTSTIQVTSQGGNNLASTLTLTATAAMLQTVSDLGGVTIALTGGTLGVTYQGGYDKTATDHCTFQFTPQTFPLTPAAANTIPTDGQSSGSLMLTRNAFAQPDTEYIATGYLYTNVSPTYVEHCSQSGDTTQVLTVINDPWFNVQTQDFKLDALASSATGHLTVQQPVGPSTTTITYDWTLTKTH
jgi:murein DD-endopeptidase MepM/ murein hydrolase activator NlpD